MSNRRLTLQAFLVIFALVLQPFLSLVSITSVGAEELPPSYPVDPVIVEEEVIESEEDSTEVEDVNEENVDEEADEDGEEESNDEENTDVEESIWQESEDGNTFTTASDVEVGIEYVYPNNELVRVIFTSLPDPSGTLTISEVTLSEEDADQLDTVSTTAYEITSTMTNGTFTYDLKLPSFANDEVVVKYAESVDELDQAEVVEEQTTVVNNTVVVKGLDHFTVFVVSDPALAGAACTAAGATSTSDCYNTIQEAIDAASDGDTILVDTTYDSANETFPITIDKELTLLGAQADVDPRLLDPDVGRPGGETIVEGDGGTIFEIESDNVEINGFKLETEDDGIDDYLINAAAGQDLSRIDIFYNIIDGEDDDSPIFLGDCNSNCDIEFNLIADSDSSSIVIEGSTGGVDINDNDIFEADENLIEIIDCDGCNVRRNVTTDANDNGVVVRDSSNVLVRLNLIDDVEDDGIEFENCEGCRAINNILTDIDDHGILTEGCTNCEFRRNSIANVDDAGFGMNLTDCTSCIAHRNTITDVDNFHGIYLAGCSSCEITNNTITDVGDDGILTEADSDGLLIKNNKISDIGGNGIKLQGCDDCQVINNTLTLIGDDAIEIEDESTEVDVEDNTMSFIDEDGIQFQSCTTCSAVNNRLVNLLGDGIRAIDPSTDITVTDNIVRNPDGNGIIFGDENGTNSGDEGGLISNNRVRNAQERCIAVYMSDTTIEFNDVRNCFGDGGAIHASTAIDNIDIFCNDIRRVGTNSLSESYGIMIGDTGGDVPTDVIAYYNSVRRVESNVGLMFNSDALADQMDGRFNYFDDSTGPLDSDDTDNSNPASNTGAGNEVIGAVDYEDFLTSQDIWTAACSEDASLTLDKSDSDDAVEAGDTLVYELDYGNASSFPVINTWLGEVVPEGTTFDEAATTAAGTTGWSCADGAAAGTECILVVGSLAAGETGTAYFAVTVDDPIDDSIIEILNEASFYDPNERVGTEVLASDTNSIDEGSIQGNSTSVLGASTTGGTLASTGRFVGVNILAAAFIIGAVMFINRRAFDRFELQNLAIKIKQA